MAGTRILVVNDDKGVLLVSSHILRNAGYEVLTASCGQACLDLMLRDPRPQLVLLDVVMPDIDGFEVCSRIKTNPNYSGVLVILYMMPVMNGIELVEIARQGHPALPVILMTAYGHKELPALALRNKCDGYIEKPFTLDQLIQEVEKAKQMHCNTGS